VRTFLGLLITLRTPQKIDRYAAPAGGANWIEQGFEAVGTKKRRMNDHSALCLTKQLKKEIALPWSADHQVAGIERTGPKNWTTISLVRLSGISDSHIPRSSRQCRGIGNNVA
jgi:hypothetical protein